MIDKLLITPKHIGQARKKATSVLFEFLQC